MNIMSNSAFLLPTNLQYIQHQKYKNTDGSTVCNHKHTHKKNLHKLGIVKIICAIFKWPRAEMNNMFKCIHVNETQT